MSAEKSSGVLKPGGVFLWYDYRCPSPLNPFTTCETKTNIDKYFPDSLFELKTMTVIPQLGRFLYRKAPWLLAVLDRMPLFHSHYFGWLVK